MVVRIPLNVKDNAEGNLDLSISASETTIGLESGDGANFPTTYHGNTDDTGDQTTLELTGIGATGIQVGDGIFNITDGSSAIVTAVNTDSLNTTKLRGGSDNTWDNGDEYAVNMFVITLNARNANDVITKSEKVLIDYRLSDSLYCRVANRGYGDSSAQTFDAADYVNIFVEHAAIEELNHAIADILTNKADDIDVIKKDGSVAMTANLNMGSNKITNLTDPTSAQDGATKQYVDDNAGGSDPVEVVFPTALAHFTSDASTEAFTSNTKGFFQFINVPHKINVNKVSLPVTSVTSSTSVDYALYSSDGQTKLWEETTAVISSGGTHVDDTSTERTIEAGLYILGFIINDGSGNITFRTSTPSSRVSTPSGGLYPQTITTETAGTLPSTIDMTSGTEAQADFIQVRLDN